MRKAISHNTALKPWKQQIQLNELTKTDLKSLVAKAVAAVMDVLEVKKNAKRVLDQSKGETHAPSD